MWVIQRMYITLTTLWRTLVEELTGLDTRGYVGHPAFRRHPQWDTYSCGARSVYAVLKHFGRKATYAEVKKELKTSFEGTCSDEIIRYLRRRGFKVSMRAMRMKDLERVFQRDGVALVYLDGDHIAPAYGADRGHVFVADPSLLRWPLKRMPRRLFRQRWDYEAIAVYPR